MIQALAGLLLLSAGALSIVFDYRPIAAFSYPIVWWGLLIFLDALHARRWGASPMRKDTRRFLGATVPASVIFWLVYEYLNLFFPQWRYRGPLQGTAVQVLFGFASFATVIPIVIEFQWLLGGPSAELRLPERLRMHLRSLRLLYVAAGLGLLVLPVASSHFWLNQGAWIAPAVVVSPFVAGRSDRPARFALSLGAAGLVSGFLWELFNFWSPTKWEYLVRPHSPHMFEMPLLGYLGFVPFAFSVAAVYAFQLRLKPRMVTVATLYAAAIAALYALVRLYQARAFWVSTSHGA